jgi:hypothetical protein
LSARAFGDAGKAGSGNSFLGAAADVAQPVRTVNKSETLAEIASAAMLSDRRARLPQHESC